MQSEPDFMDCKNVQYGNLGLDANGNCETIENTIGSCLAVCPQKTYAINSACGSNNIQICADCHPACLECTSRDDAGQSAPPSEDGYNQCTG